MAKLKSPHRPATPEDAHALAELLNMAGDGMPEYLWEGMAEPDQTAWDVGRYRASNKEKGFYLNATVREEDGRVVAALIGYPLPRDPEPVDYVSMPSMFVPLQQLEELVPGTWYVNVLATYPEHRGKGYGQTLLDIATDKARTTGRSGLSLIVSDSNTGARRMYERYGFSEIATKPMVKENWENAGQNWVLLAMDI